MSSRTRPKGRERDLTMLTQLHRRHENGNCLKLEICLYYDIELQTVVVRSLSRFQRVRDGTTENAEIKLTADSF